MKKSCLLLHTPKIPKFSIQVLDRPRTNRNLGRMMDLNLKPLLRLVSKSHQIPNASTSVLYAFFKYIYLSPNWKHLKVPRFSKYISQVSLKFCFWLCSETPQFNTSISITVLHKPVFLHPHTSSEGSNPLTNLDEHSKHAENSQRR